MSIQESLTRLATAALCVFFCSFEAFGDHRPSRSEDVTLAALAESEQALTLNDTVREIRIPFTIAAGAEPEAVELILNAAPASEQSNGRIEAFVNRARAVELQPRAKAFEARFALYSDGLRPGENELVLRLTGDVRSGWIIDAVRSRLRVAAAAPHGYAALAQIEQSLRADFAAPRRVHIDAAAAGRDELAVASLVAPGLALRMQQAPILVQDPGIAELIVRAEVRPGYGAPAIDLTNLSEMRLAAGQTGSLIAAARLFAARSMEDHLLRFDMAAALQAPRLSSPRPDIGQRLRLENLAALGAPFGSDQGGRAAVVLAPSENPDDQIASLALVARAALASGSAWLYAWYGDDIEAAPANHDIMLLGPQNALDPRLMASAPAEVRAATSAAANRTPRRHLGSTAYASDNTQRNARITGVAAIFEQSDGRRVALFTAPDGADYARAAERLARSELWSSLEGRAVLWDSSAVTAFGPSAAPRFSAEWIAQLVRVHDEYFALGAFSVAVLLLLIGVGVNRTSRRRT